MSEIKYLLVAIPHEWEANVVHKNMLERVQKILPGFHTKSSIGAHITICPPFTVQVNKLEFIKQKLSTTIGNMKIFPISLVSWNYFTDNKNKIQTLYRVIDAKAYVHQQLLELHQIPYEEKARHVGARYDLHLHLTLGTVLLSSEEFKKFKNEVNWAVMKDFSPMELCIDKFVLYKKDADHKDWQELNVFKM